MREPSQTLASLGYRDLYISDSYERDADLLMRLRICAARRSTRARARFRRAIS
jgi:hypothetical protein